MFTFPNIDSTSEWNFSTLSGCEVPITARKSSILSNAGQDLCDSRFNWRSTVVSNDTSSHAISWSKLKFFGNEFRFTFLLIQNLKLFFFILKLK